MLRDLGTGARFFLYVVIGMIAVAVFAFLSIYVFGSVQNTTADYRGRTDARERTVADGAFRIGTYEQFFDLCQSVQTSEAAIRNAQKELDTDPAADRKAQLQQVITAQSNIRAESITTYNSKASQEHRQAFLDAALPARLDLNTQETQCAA
jgi:predicted negative regulator of RcsB-dependent stress response